jgi:hypothetical protein
MLHNARVEYQQEAHEIATYTVIDSLATAAGDKQRPRLPPRDRSGLRGAGRFATDFGAHCAFTASIAVVQEPSWPSTSAPRRFHSTIRKGSVG